MATAEALAAVKTHDTPERRPPGRRGRSAWSGSPFTVSLGVHLTALAFLGALVAPPGVQPTALVLVAATPTAEVEIEPLVIQPFPDPPVEQPGGEADVVVVGAVDVGDAMAVDHVAIVPRDDVAIPFAGDLGAEFDAVGLGTADDRGAAAAATFFGTTTQGQRFVFVLDNSNSMAHGRLETAFAELQKAVDALGPTQSFYVILFSDTCYRMFHPRPAATLVPAVPENKRRLREWLATVEMCLQTRGEDAVAAAVAMQPDVISILGDGRFTDRATQLLTSPHDRGIVINTFGMQVDPAGRRDLKAIAEANGGRFKPVDTSRAAVSLARSRPIRRNTVNGDVWGLGLPSGPGR